MRHLSLMIFDLDNTIYDWYSAFLPAFYDMVDVAVKALDCDTEALLDELQRVHVKHHDVEHPFSLAETTIVQEMIQKRGIREVKALLDPAFHAFNKTRKANLRLFPGTSEALTSLANRGIRLVAYTDSKYYAALGRIERLGIDNLFEVVYCREKSRGSSIWEGMREPAAELARKVVQLPSHESKPNPRVLTDIVTAQGHSMARTGYVGDSLAKDVLMANRAGCFSIWAKYGAHTDPNMYQRLIRISHWTEEDIRREKHYLSEAKFIVPDFICKHSINEILMEIPGPD